MNDECACHAPKSEQSRNLETSDIELLVELFAATPDWERRVAELSEAKEAALTRSPQRRWAYDDMIREDDLESDVREDLSESSYEIVLQEDTSESEIPDSPAVPGNPNAEAPTTQDETSGKPWRHLRESRDANAHRCNETRLGDKDEFTPRGQKDDDDLAPFERLSHRGHRFRIKQRQFQVPHGRKMPDPKYGMPEHYLYGSGTPSAYNADMITVHEYKAAPHLNEYKWNHARERHRLPDDMGSLYQGTKSQNFQELLRQ